MVRGILTMLGQPLFLALEARLAHQCLFRWSDGADFRFIPLPVCWDSEISSYIRCPAWCPWTGTSLGHRNSGRCPLFHYYSSHNESIWCSLLRWSPDAGRPGPARVLSKTAFVRCKFPPPLRLTNTDPLFSQNACWQLFRRPVAHLATLAAFVLTQVS
jgi:hypothetical protein